MTRTFPDSFSWGAATAAYQIEGAASEGGRGPSIWDTFSHTPGATWAGDTGDVAADHYHRWRDDVALMKKLHLDAYRLSISWPRVQPGGRGALNPEGVEFYRDLLNTLVEQGIKPAVTLYHWDLPQELQDQGGWTNRTTALAFAEYARAMAREFGALVDIWTTLNEPWCSAYLGYASGVHAPGIIDRVAALTAVHHLNLAHGLATSAIRDELGEQARVSITLNLHLVRPHRDDSDEDQAAARQLRLVGNEAFLGPILDGDYPPDLLDLTAPVTDWSFVQQGDQQLIGQRLDVLGINYYSTATVRRRMAGPGPVSSGGHGNSPVSPWVACEDVEFLHPEGPLTAMGWNIAPEGLYDLLLSVGRRWPELPLMVTENGAAFDDEVSVDGSVHDPERVRYLHDHIDAVGRALDDGVDLRGYFVWSLLDNFEWSYGYAKRFGIIRVDYQTLQRTEKTSAHWYAELVSSRSLPAVDAGG